MKRCGTCKEMKELSLFTKDKHRVDGLNTRCKACLSVMCKKYNQNNKDKITKRKKQYAIDNPELRQSQVKTSYTKHAERRRIYSNNYRKERKPEVALYTKNRRNSDPQFKLAHNLRVRLTSAIKKDVKRGSSVRDLGMPINAFLIYLNLDCLDKYGIPYTGNEQYFDIDHIKPLASFDLTDRMQLLAAVNWSNMQILTKTENRTKGARK